MKRRDFLKYNLHGALWLAAGSAGLFAPGTLFASDVPDLGVAYGGPGPATRAAVELLGGISAFVKEGQRVVIKPNMSFANPPENATTTHPEVVRELVAMCMEAKASSVLVLDHPLQSHEMCLESSGIEAACDAIRNDTVHAVADASLFAEADFTEAVEMKGNLVMKEVLKADVLIGAPVAKSHSGAGVSLTMKGMMGLVLNRSVMHSRYNLHQAIVDLNTFCKADLAVVDATRVLTTNGPRGPGKVDNKNMVVASADCVAADAYTVSACTWWGRKMRPDQVEHIRLAHKQGLGRMDVENLRVAEVTL